MKKVPIEEQVESLLRFDRAGHHSETSSILPERSWIKRQDYTISTNGITIQN